MAKQGQGLDDTEIRTILNLLKSTDTPIPAIATRMGCSRSAVVAINRKFQIRDYGGRRSTWEMVDESHEMSVLTKRK